MFKKTLISLAVASSVGLTGCFDSGETGANANPNPTYTDVNVDGKTWPIFNPAARPSPLVPVPNDLQFSGSVDGTFAVANPEPPVLSALDGLSGASTVDPIIIKLSGDIDKNTVDGKPFVVVDGNVVPNPDQTVFLIALDYASGDPVQGLSNQEKPTIKLESQKMYEADVVELDGNSAIRILPLEPLDPKKRYLAVVTNGVEDINGEPIIKHPNPASYAALADQDANLVSDALEPVRNLVTKFWEPTAESYFKAVGASYTKADIALSYSLTTSNDVKVTEYIANPNHWISDQVENSIKVSAAKRAVGAALFFQGVDLNTDEIGLNGFQKWDLNRDNTVDADDFNWIADPDPEITTADFLAPGNTNPTMFDHSDIEYFVTITTENFQAAAFNQELAGCDTAFPDSFEGKIACIGNGLAANPAFDFPVPEDRITTLTASQPAVQKSAVLSSVTGSNLVSIAEGTIDLPYYLGIPDSESGDVILNKFWTADATLAQTINTVFAGAGLVLPQGKDGEDGKKLSQFVNYLFPFPAPTSTVTSPSLVIHPSTVDLSVDTIDDVVIFQHGITTDRSASMAFGTALVAAGLGQGRNIAVVAIDQPLHGVSPASIERREGIAETLLEGAGIIGESTPTEEREATITAVVEGSFSTGALVEITTSGFCNDVTFDINDPVSVQTAKLTIAGGGCESNTAVFAEQMRGALGIEQTVANSGSTIPGLTPVTTTAGIADSGATERHFAYTNNPDYVAGSQADQTAPMSFTPDEDGETLGGSGDLFINLSNFLNNRDNLRQGAVDLLNLRASIPDMAPAFAGATVHFVGHSLGTVNGNAFVMAANAGANSSLTIANSHLVAPASGLVRMLENSPSFAPTILGGLKAQAQLTQADGDLQTFFNVFQAAIDTVDPVNFVDQLKNSNTLISQVFLDRTTINAADTQYGEQYVPFKANIGSLVIDSDVSPLAGSEPLASLIGAQGLSDGFPAITRYEEGTHSTPVLPLKEVAEAPNLAEFEFEFLKDRTIAQGGEVLVTKENAEATFTGLVEQTLQMILTPTP